MATNLFFKCNSNTGYECDKKPYELPNGRANPAPYLTGQYMRELNKRSEGSKNSSNKQNRSQVIEKDVHVLDVALEDSSSIAYRKYIRECKPEWSKKKQVREKYHKLFQDTPAGKLPYDVLEMIQLYAPEVVLELYANEYNQELCAHPTDVYEKNNRHGSYKRKEVLLQCYEDMDTYLRTLATLQVETEYEEGWRPQPALQTYDDLADYIDYKVQAVLKPSNYYPNNSIALPYSYSDHTRVEGDRSAYHVILQHASYHKEWVASQDTKDENRPRAWKYYIDGIHNLQLHYYAEYLMDLFLVRARVDFVPLRIDIAITNFECARGLMSSEVQQNPVVARISEALKQMQQTQESTESYSTFEDFRTLTESYSTFEDFRTLKELLRKKEDTFDPAVLQSRSEREAVEYAEMCNVLRISSGFMGFPLL